jgi:hypothetical protein
LIDVTRTLDARVESPRPDALAWNLHRAARKPGVEMTRQQRALMLFALLLISAVVLGYAGNEARANDAAEPGATTVERLALIAGDYRPGGTQRDRRVEIGVSHEDGSFGNEVRRALLR